MLKIPATPFKIEEISDEHPFVIEALRKRGRNEDCWCLSGQKYKRCHLNKESLATPRLRELLANTNRLFWKRRECLHPKDLGSACSESVISAHTLQRKGVLEKVTKNHHVYKLDMLDDNPNNLGPRKISWKKASTFPGFCSEHDAALFKNIETLPFTGTHEQCVLQSYRAVCNELYKKLGLIDTLQYQKQTIDNGKSLDDQISHQLSANKSIENSLKSIEELKFLKKKYETAIFNNDFSIFKSGCYFFNGDFNFVGAGVSHIEYSFSGEKLADIWDLTQDADSVAHSVMATSSGGAFFFCYETDSSAGDEFIKSFDSLPDDDKSNIFTQYCFLQSENNFFSLEWWETLDEISQKFLKKLFSVHYHEGGTYTSQKKLSNWEITGKAPR